MEAFVFLFMTLLLCGCALGKECTNIPTQSHTLYYQVLTSRNDTWKSEVLSNLHVTPSDESAFEDKMSRRFMTEKNKHVMYRKLSDLGTFNPPKGILKEVPLQHVRLHGDDGSIFWRAQQTNLEYMLMLDVDRMLWCFRKTAGLPTPGMPYGGWEAANIELRGHFVGHYLSASALMWASTNNDILRKRMDALVAGLSACQEKIGSGYLSAFPSELFDRVEAIKSVWAPYYTIHKILAGLLDQHTIAGNPQALKMVTWMVDYFYNRVQNVIKKFTVEKHYLSQNTETGGMNDVLYQLYSLTRDPKHLELAHLFDKPCFLGLLAMQVDDIGGYHANTHIPIVVGAQMRYEVLGDPLYKEMATFFMNTINSSHSYATGGTSEKEFWHNPKRIADNLKSVENEESCTTYNMLKVSRHMFRWTKEVTYADYYERALTNGVLSIQRGTDPGVMVYMLPLGLGVSKAKTYHSWGTPFNDFWCCYGTGIESFSKLGDSIYFNGEGKRDLYIIQYISSSFNWKSGKILLNQTVLPASSWDPYVYVTFTVSRLEKTMFPQKTGTTSTLNFRLPSWTRTDGAKGMLNGETLSLPTPENFLSIKRKWSPGDTLTLQFPLTIRTEAIKDDRPEYASVQAILYGPYLLAGHTFRDWDIKVVGDWITPIPSIYNSQLVCFSQAFNNSSFVLTNSNQSLTMQKSPGPGTEIALHATFRLVLKGSSSNVSSMTSSIGKSVMLEPIDLPGMNVVHQGANQPLIISQGAASAVFLVVPGLDGRKEAISLESESNKGCYVYSGLSSGSGVKLSCISGSDATFKHATSFVVEKGLRQYSPISFVAKGTKRNFLLEPLFSFRDERYTAYFNIQN